MPKDNNHSWLRGRLERRAKDARQAQTYISQFCETGYPDAKQLAIAHAQAAEVYEKALAGLDE